MWIHTVSWDDSDGLLREAYDWQAASLGEPAEFTMLGSLYPEIVMERLRLYKAVEACPSGLSPIERQAAAFTTSTANGTAHCASGSRLKLASLGAPDDLVAAIEAAAQRPEPAPPGTGDARLDAVCLHAAKLTRRPTEMTADDLDALRAHGLDDLALVDLNNIVAYYNYINRIVMGLGLRTTMATTHEATRALPD